MVHINNVNNGEIIVKIETTSLDKIAGNRILRELPQFFGNEK